MEIEIVNSEARFFLEDLESKGLIRIKPEVSLSAMLIKLRRNESEIPSEEEIVAEVEAVRQSRYEKQTKNNY